VKVKDFKAVPPEDYPKLPKELWDVLGPIQSQIRDLTQLVQKKIGGDNINEEVLEGKIIPAVESIFQLTTLNGAPKGAYPILVDSTSHISLFKFRIVDEKKVGITITLDPAVTTEVTARILVKGA
jgi:hypothetical protein